MNYFFKDVRPGSVLRCDIKKENKIRWILNLRKIKLILLWKENLGPKDKLL